VLVVAGLAFLLTPMWTIAAPDDKKDEPATATSSEDSIEKVEADHSKAMEAFYKEYRKAENREAALKVYREKYPKPSALFPRLWKIAEANAGKPDEAKALVWIVSRRAMGDDLAKALKRLGAKHAKSDAIEQALPGLAYTTHPQAEKFLRRVFKQNPKKELKGKAAFYLAKHLANLAGEVRSAKAVESPEGEQARLAKLDPKKVESRAAKMYERVMKQYADIEARRGTLGAHAKNSLFAMRNLGIGKVAPEIEGEDIFGEKFKLSDYRGKIILLDFWGHW